MSVARKGALCACQHRLPAVLIVLMMLIAGRAWFSPVIHQQQQAQAALPVKRVLFGANVLDPFVSVDRGTLHVDSVQRYNATGGENGLLRHLYPSIDTLPLAGTGLLLDPEVVMRRKPDAVLVWAGRDAALNAMGIPGVIVLHSALKHQTQQHLDMWSLFGHLTSNDAHAAAMAQRYEEKRRALQKTIQALHQPAPRVLLMVGGFGKGYWLGPPMHYLNERFTAVGATIVNQRGPGGGADVEHIMMLDPDVIFLSDSGTGDRMTPQQLYTLPEWQVVRAVKAHRVYIMPALPSFTTPVEDPIRLQWLAEVLYPQLISRDVRTEIRETLQAAYHYRPSDEDIDRLLNIKENHFSAHYTRFNRSTGVPAL